MDDDKMSHPGSAPLARRTATNGARPEKEQPPLPSDATQADPQRASTPTAPGPRGQPRPQKAAPARSATLDPSTPAASPTKKLAQPSAPPGLPPPPVPAAPSVSSASGKRTPIEEWEAIPQLNTVEQLQAKVAELNAIIKQKDADIQKHKEALENYEKDKESLAYFTNKSLNLESDAYRQEVLSIRRHLQVDEVCEPWEINKRFGEIVRKIEDICRDLGESLGLLPAIGSHTTLDLLKLVSRTSEGQHLVAATPTAKLDLEDFIDFGCRSLINEALYNNILGSSAFHPGLGQEENANYYDMYNRIRREEPQVVAGRWRISTLKLFADRSCSPKEVALRLCNDSLLPFCSAVVESKACVELIQSMLPRFEELLKRAYDWSYLTKGSVIMLDFHPYFQSAGSPYKAEYISLEGRKPKPPSSNAILLTSKLGLWSSSAVGNGKGPEYSIQTKATVLAAEYFS